MFLIYACKFGDIKKVTTYVGGKCCIEFCFQWLRVGNVYDVVFTEWQDLLLLLLLL